MTLRFDLRTNRTFSGTGAHVRGSLFLVSLKYTNGCSGEIQRLVNNIKILQAILGPTRLSATYCIYTTV